MRKVRPLSPALSAALLALTVTVCTGSLTEGAAAHELISQSQDRGMVDQRNEGVTSLLSCLSDVAKSLYPQQRQVTARGFAHRTDPVFTETLFADINLTASAGALPESPLRPALLNLPPPARR